MLCILKIPTKFGIVPQSFCQNQNPVQDQDQDQDHDFTLDFNTRPTFHTQKTLTKFCLHSLTPSKVIVSTAKVHVQAGKQTDRRIFFACFLRNIKHEHSSEGEFFFTHAITILSLFTHAVCDEKVIIFAKFQLCAPRRKRAFKLDLFSFDYHYVVTSVIPIFNRSHLGQRITSLDILEINAAYRNPHFWSNQKKIYQG